MPPFLCGTPEMPKEKTFFLPDFGCAHLSDPRLHVSFYAFCFGDMSLPNSFILSLVKGR
jgi:hypothetical protein